MTEIVFAPGELAPRRHLYVVRWGVVLHGGKVLTRCLSNDSNRPVVRCSKPGGCGADRPACSSRCGDSGKMWGEDMILMEDTHMQERQRDSNPRPARVAAGVMQSR